MAKGCDYLEILKNYYFIFLCFNCPYIYKKASFLNTIDKCYNRKEQNTGSNRREETGD